MPAGNVFKYTWTTKTQDFYNTFIKLQLKTSWDTIMTSSAQKVAKTVLQCFYDLSLVEWS